MASEDGSGIRESRNEEQTGPFTFQTGTLCGLYPLLLPSGSYPPLHPLQPENPRRDTSKDFPATVTPKSLSCKPDAHFKSGRSSWNSPTLGPETLVPRERGAQSATNEEISWDKGGLPLFLEDWKFQQQMQKYRQEVANILREIQEDVAQISATNVLPGMAKEPCAPKLCPPKSSLPTRRRLTFDT